MTRKALALMFALACASVLSIGMVGCGSAGGSSSAPSSGAAASTSASGTASSSEAADPDDPFAQPIENETDALNRVHDLLMRAGKEVPPKIEFDSMTEDDRYLIHGYEVVKDGADATHESTWFYYSVGDDGSIYDVVLMEELDPLTMEPLD